MDTPFETEDSERQYQRTRRLFANAGLEWTRDDEREQNKQVQRNVQMEVSTIRYRIDVELSHSRKTRKETTMRRYRLTPFDPSATPYTDEETAFDAYVVRECIELVPEGTWDFANSLVTQWHDKGVLSVRQRYYLHEIQMRVVKSRGTTARIVVEAALNNAAQL